MFCTQTLEEYCLRRERLRYKVTNHYTQNPSLYIGIDISNAIIVLQNLEYHNIYNKNIDVIVQQMYEATIKS